MLTVLVPLAQGCEELEAVTIIDLLRRADLEVITASLDDKPVICSRKTQIIADTTLNSVLNKEIDLMVLPGGLPGADNLNNDPRIHQLIDRLTSENKYIAAICAAPKVLLTNGTLKNKKATAYPGSLQALDHLIQSNQTQLNEEPIQIDGKIITSRGPGTAMDFSLTLIEVLLGKKAREQVESPLYRS